MNGTGHVSGEAHDAVYRHTAVVNEHGSEQM